MSKFKIGDRVKVIGKEEHWHHYAGIGDIGTVKGYSEYGTHVDLDKENNRYHDCYGFCRPNHGQFIDECNLELPPQQKIVITTDGTTTLARLYDGKKVVKTAEAKCSPSDTFDFATGAKLAFDRLKGREDAAVEPEKPKYYNGKVVCVKTDISFTLGKVYEFVDGRIKDDDGELRPAHKHGVTDLATDYWAKGNFVPLVEG